MKWFKHDTDASTDARIKKLIMHYGTDGYAIYFHCLELIAGDINESNITFELEHDAEIIADDLKIQGTATVSAVDRVNEIMRYIIDIGLFECQSNHIFCFKLLHRLDISMTSNSRLRKLITEAKDRHDKVMINHDSVMIKSCKNRIEENRIEESTAPDKKSKYGPESNVLLTDSEYQKLREEYGKTRLDAMLSELSYYKLSSGKKYKSDYGAIRKWVADKVIKSTPKTTELQNVADMPGFADFERDYDRLCGITPEPEKTP
jgi:hypothetical protein